MSQTLTQTASYRESAGPSTEPLGATLPDGGFGSYVAEGPSVLQQTALGMSRADIIVSGANRHKYFRRPIIPFMNAQPPEVIFASQAHEEATLAAPEPEPEPMSKDMGCQSDFRESEVQTDPFTPDYVLPAGSTAEPELLTLATLKYGEGLPAGLAEVKMIERARQKREFEASLPPMTDEASLTLRKKMMGEQELREWNLREAEILKQQTEKLAAFDETLRAAADERELHWDERIEHIRQIKLTEKDKEISQIQRRRIKALRKLSEARKDIEGKETTRDVVTEYADYGSEVYAPLARNGNITRDKLSHQYETKPLQLETLAGLQALERSMPPRMVKPKVARPAKVVPSGYGARKELKMQAQLERTDAALKAAKQAKPSEKEQKEALLAAYRDTKPVERPPTPTAPPIDADEELESGCVLLQRLLRGRAIQNMMFEGKERRLELIHELRSDEEAKAADAAEEAAAETEAAVDGLVAALQAELVGGSLDTMSKELRRFTEERRIAEMIRAAEKTRRVREAAESGARQKELVERAEADERFRQLMRVNNASAASYIGEVMREVVETAAATEAERLAELKHSRVNAIADRLEERHSSAAATIDDVVTNFLFPEVLRQTERRQHAQEDTKYATASARALESVMGEVEAQLEAL